MGMTKNRRSLITLLCTVVHTFGSIHSYFRKMTKSNLKEKKRYKNKPQDRKALKRKLNKLKKRQAKSNTKFKEDEIQTKPGERILYYSIYRGWTAQYNAFFIHPFHALCWTQWMLMKDLIMHLWHDKSERPLWHSCVGVVCVSDEFVRKVDKKKKLWGNISRHFFEGVDVFEYIGNEKLQTTLIRANEEILERKRLLFKYHADYMQSAGSIFRTKSKIVDIMDNYPQDIVGWIITPQNSVGISGNYKDSKLIDVGMRVRHTLRDSMKDRDARKYCILI